MSSSAILRLRCFTSGPVSLTELGHYHASEREGAAGKSLQSFAYSRIHSICVRPLLSIDSRGNSEILLPRVAS